MPFSDKITEIITHPDCQLLEALKRMDSIRRKLLLVLDKERYVGLISIGDIQRAIINNISLNTPISKILRNDYIIVQPETSFDEIKKLMLLIRAEFMPVVNLEKKVVAIHFWDELFGERTPSPAKKFSLPVVIMAGGLGSRLKPLTNVLPKPLIPIGNKSIIEDIFERFGNHGCNEFFISVNYKSELIEFYLRNQKLPYKLSFFKEETPMGTAGSISLLKGKINQTFFVSNCDVLIEQDYSEILDYHRENRNEITVVAALKNYPIPYGTIETGEHGQLLSLIEKPELTFKINSGMYILEPELIDQIPENTHFHITHLIEKVKERNGKVGVFPVSEKSWKDIGEWNLLMNEM